MIADRYRLERKVGGGRVSAVWRVRDEISSRPCALKILHRSMHKHPEALTRFSLEDRLARELTGPHFAERVGSGVWDGMRYIAWRWHEGETLRALFERNPKQDAPTVHSIVQETCQALALVHAAGYAHGDLKPENILFTDRGDGGRPTRQIKLLGFGVASRVARASAAGFGGGRRRPGEFVGTPLYASPDLVLGRVPDGGQADVWALAAIVYEALTGRPPFLGGDIGAVLQAILEKRAPKPSSVADNLPGSIDTWWAQALEQEFRSPSELAGALARALAPALRTSHTQRSASLPDRAPSALEATPMPSRPPAPGAASASSTTSSGIGPAGVSLARSAAGFTGAPSVAGRAPGTSSAAMSSSSESRPPSARPVTASPLAVSGPASASGGAIPAATSSAAAPPAAVSPTSVSSPVASAAASLTTSPAPSPTAIAPAAVSTAAPPAARRPPAPAPLSVAPAAPDASAPLTSAVSPLPGSIPRANEAARSGARAQESFSPFPSPLRDLGADGVRKTLVGITPPLPPQSSAASAEPPATRRPSPKPSASWAGVHVSASPTTRGLSPVLTEAIEGAPCKPIETREARVAFDPALLEGGRRPANPTVPFPRPRVSPRTTATMPTPASTDESSEIGRTSWHGTTTRTLRFVLTSPDHKPQRIAAALVCGAAALVIFAVGRSPVAGTAGIGQTTEALSADPAPKAPAAPPLAADPGRAELAAADGPASMDDGRDADEARPREAELDALEQPTRLDGDEPAPGLVVPARGNPVGSPPVAPQGRDSAGPGDGTAPHRAATPPAASTPPARKTPPPSPSSSLPTPARNTPTELDFGI